jgi:hypothetical protein
MNLLNAQNIQDVSQHRGIGTKTVIAVARTRLAVAEQINSQNRSPRLG